MIDEMNVMITGVGGQGALTLAGIMADASMKSGINALTGEVHGMAQRGGSVFAHLRMGKKVHGPIIPLGRADVIVSLELVEALRYLDFLSVKGVIIVSKTPIIPPIVWTGMGSYPDEEGVVAQYKRHSEDVYLIDSLGLAIQAGNPLTANIVLLGALAARVELPFKKQIIFDSIASVMPPKILDVNVKAFELGWEGAQKSKV